MAIKMTYVHVYIVRGVYVQYSPCGMYVCSVGRLGSSWY